MSTRIDAIELCRYGRFTDQTLNFEAGNFHLVLGANEAGKSTLRQAFHDLLFGIPLNTPMSFLHAGTDLELRAQLSGSPGRKAFARKRKRNGGLSDLDGAALPADALQPWLGTVNATFFERMFGLDHQRLAEGSRAMLEASDNVDSVLFQAAAGVAALNGVLESLRQEATTLWAPHHSRNRAWYAAQSRLAEASNMLKAATVRPTAWARAERESRRLDEAYSQAQAKHHALIAQSREIERLRRLAPIMAQIREHEATLQNEEGAGATHGLLAAHEPQILKLDETRLRISDHRTEIQQCVSRLQLLRQQLVRVLRQVGHHMPSEHDASLDALLDQLPLRPLRREIEQLLQDGRQRRAQFDTAERALKERRGEIDALRAEISSLPTAVVSQSLRIALDTTLSAGDTEAQLEAARSHLAREEEALRRRLATLAQPGVDVPSNIDDAVAWLNTMMPWSATSVAEEIQRRQQLRSNLDALSKQVKDSESAYAAAKLTLDQFRRTHQAVSRDEVMVARRERDALWEQLLEGQASLLDEGPRFTSLLRGADALVDQHLDAVEAAARLQALEHELERREQTQAAHRRQLAEAQNELKQFDAAWASKCGERRVPNLSPLDMQAWLAERLAVLPIYDRLEAARRDLERVAARHEALRHDLLDALHGESMESDSSRSVRQLALSEPSLAEACAQAQARLKEAEEIQAKRLALSSQIARHEATIPALERQSQHSALAIQQWREAWQHALQRAGMPLDASDAYIEEAIALLADADALAEQIRACRLREQQLNDELIRYRQSVRELGAFLGADPDGNSDPDTLVAAWRQSLHQYHQSQRAIQQAQDRLVQCQEQLLKEGEGRSREQIEAELADVDIAELAPKSQQLDDMMRGAAAEVSRLAVEREHARQALDEMSGGNEAALAEAQRQEALADMAEVAERYVHLYAQYRLLERVTERYREQRQGPLLARAGQLFASLTRGAHAGLVVDGVEAALYARRADGSLVGLNGLSDGTRDQLYLSLRIAALELYLDHAPALPFIADDLFINYDDARAVAGLELLGKVAQRTQVIFLTHHAHMVELAQQALGDKVNLIELPRSAG